MKRKIIFQCMFVLVFSIYSQESSLECNFQPDSRMYQIANYSATLRTIFENDEPIVFNVNFIIVNPSGTTTTFLDENKLLKEIASLNIYFNVYNIFYKYRGFTILNINFTGNLDVEAKLNLIRMQPEYNLNSINIILFESVFGASANFGRQEITARSIDIINSNGNVNVFYGNILIHEAGHLLGLFHTFHFTGDASNCDDDTADSSFCVDNDTQYQEGASFSESLDIGYAPVSLTIPNFDYQGNSSIPTNINIVAENVTRIVSDSNYNANIAGDLVVDTPAQFKGSENNYFEGISEYFGIGYHYIPHPSILDQVGDMYVDVDFQNFMSYFEHEKTHFTNGQGVRMRETIQNYPQVYARVRTSVAELYEPYTNDYFDIGYYSPSHRPLFQPGFDYTFVQCGGNQQNYGVEIYNTPANYEDVSFIFSTNIHSFGYAISKHSLNFNDITHLNHTAIFIEQLNNLPLNGGGQPRKCYNNFNRNASSGTVIKYRDGVLNANISKYYKNETEINDQNLIINLENGLYIIKKQYEDGSQEQKTIYKNVP